MRPSVTWCWSPAFIIRTNFLGFLYHSLWKFCPMAWAKIVWEAFFLLHLLLDSPTYLCTQGMMGTVSSLTCGWQLPSAWPRTSPKWLEPHPTKDSQCTTRYLLWIQVRVRVSTKLMMCSEAVIASLKQRLTSSQFETLMEKIQQLLQQDGINYIGMVLLLSPPSLDFPSLTCLR